ncbi:MAG: SIMPL domain-containing protein [Candidatus Komeilibacteria bacterium]|nr:SIMPL domain-containing protein [Candidatus Komeilibacteria bacterium]
MNNDQIKNYLYIAIILTLILGSVATIRYVSAYAKASQPSSYRSFNVSGDGKEVVVPDVAQFSFSVITEGGKEIANLQKENTDKINKAVEYLKSKDIDKKDITTENYSVDPRYQYFNCVSGRVCPPAEITGYTVSQTVSVKIRNFDIIGDTLTGVVQNGANNVSQLQFTIDDPTEVQNQARAKAIAKAQSKAKTIAETANFGLGRLLSIDEGSQSTPVPLGLGGYGMGGEIARDKAVSIPSIEPGAREVNVYVTLTYEIE